MILNKNANLIESLNYSLVSILIVPAFFIINIELFSQPIPITVNLSQKFQTIDNFSASDAWWADAVGGWNLSNRNRVADLLFSRTKGIGLSAWRFNVGGGEPSKIGAKNFPQTFEVAPGVFDWTHQANESWFLQAAKERGVNQFIAFVNSPPAWMTRNGHTWCTSGLGTTNLMDGYEGQFGSYLAEILIHFRDSLGINFTEVSPVNEPQWEWTKNNQEGNRACNTDIKRIVDSLYAALIREKVSTKIMIPENGALPDWYQNESGITSKYGKTYGSYLTQLFSDTSVTNKVSNIMAGHSYWSDLLNGQLVERRQTLGSKMAPYFQKGFKYWATEYCIMASAGPFGNGAPFPDYTMTSAIDIIRIVHFDLTLVNASAWQYWTALEGLLYSNSTIQSVFPNKVFWAFGNYSRFLRPGSIRVGCTGAMDKLGLMASAYIDSGSSKVFIVLVNASDTLKNINLAFTGLGSVQHVNYLTPYVTSNDAGDGLRKYPYISVDGQYNVPAQSVITLVGNLDGSVYNDGSPGTAILNFPVSGDTLNEHDTTLTWQLVNGADSYEVQFSPDTTFTRIVLDLPNLTVTQLGLNSYIIPARRGFQPTNTLGLNFKYYWRVIAANDSGESYYSNVGSFVTPAYVTSVVNYQPGSPNLFSLNQNYPNPFNPATTIEYSIPSASFVNVKVYDVLGREIVTLVNTNQNPGKYSVEFNGSGLSSGIYFIRMEAGNYISIKKIVLAK